MRFLMALVFCAVAQPLLADAVLMKNGERYVGDVTDLGTTLRVKNAAHPDGLEVKKSDVKTIYPKPEVMLQNLSAEIEKARARYEAGKKAADPNPGMKAAIDLLFDPELEVDEAIQIYPDFKAKFVEVQTSIHELRKMCRDAQVSAKPAPDPGNPKPDPKPDPKKAPDPNGGPPTPADPKPATPQPSANSDELLLAPPADAKPNDIEKVAKLMQVRATEHGFVGVTTKVVRQGDFQLVQMTCKDGLTPEMRKRLVWYADRMGSRFEVRVARCLSPGESEQFPTPSLEAVDSGKAKAPKGMKWYRTPEGGVIVLLDKYVITPKDFGKMQVGDKGGVYYEITNKQLAGTLHADDTLRDANVCAGIYFVSETSAWSAKNTCLIFEGAPGNRTYLDTNFSEPDWKVLLTIINHPLPFRLTEVK